MTLHTSSAATPSGRLALAAVALLVLTSCDGTVTPDPQQHGTETEETIDLVGDSPFEVEATITPRPGMLDVEPVQIWYETSSVDARTLLVTFASQGPPCQMLDRVEVDETDTQVTITLYQGRDPDIDPDHPCDGPTHVVGVDVPLSRDHGPTPYSLAGITAETGEGAVVNGGHLTERN